MESPAQPELVDKVRMSSCAFSATVLKTIDLPLVLQFWAQECMSSAEKRKEQLQEIRRSFQRADGDCGSSEVQGEANLALLYIACHGAQKSIHSPLAAVNNNSNNGIIVIASTASHAAYILVHRQPYRTFTEWHAAYRSA